LRPLLDEELDRLERRYENKSVATGRLTPFDDLNWMTAGLQPSDLIIIAARPSMGKTALAVQMAQYIALNEKLPVALFSLEMSKEQLVTRMICSESKVDAQHLRTGQLRPDDWQKVGEGIDRLSEAPIYIDDSPDISAMEMRAKCRRLKAEHGLGLIMIDYLQLMRGHKRSENRNQELSDISRACKGLARELKVPVIALSQLSRAVESRTDKRPMLSDLRESGAIEAEADVVMFIYRDAYYKMKEAVEDPEEEAQRRERHEEQIEEAELIVAKQRNGPTGRVIVGFLKQYARFENLDRAHRGYEGE
jgi:replicative DNA helicase